MNREPPRKPCIHAGLREMTRERRDKKDASNAEKIDAALFLRPEPLRRRHAGRIYFHARSRKTASNRRFQGKKETLGGARMSRGPGVLTERYTVRKSARKHARRGFFAADRRGGIISGDMIAVLWLLAGVGIR